MKLNILTAKTGNYAEEPIILSKEDFWEYYLKLLNVRNNFTLIDREIKVMAYVLSNDFNKSHFKGKEGEKLRETLKIKAPDLSKIKNQLIIKGYIADTGATRGDALPVNNIRNFQQYINNCIETDTPVVINFLFPFEIYQEKNGQAKITR